MQLPIIDSKNCHNARLFSQGLLKYTGADIKTKILLLNTSSSISRCLSLAVLGCRLSSEVNAGLPELLVDGWSRLLNGSAEMAAKSASEKLSDERMRGGGTGLIGRRFTCGRIVG